MVTLGERTSTLERGLGDDDGGMVTDDFFSTVSRA